MAFTVLLAWFSFTSLRVHATGSWTPLANPAPTELSTMLLLSDGTVMASDGGYGWYRLTPDARGSYVNGTWTELAAMHDSRLYFASAVLRDGRVFVGGGEYGTGSTTAEVYDPVSNTWLLAPPSGQNFLDAVAATLPDGKVLIAPVYPSVSGISIIFNPVSNSWSSGFAYAQPIFDQDEATWIKLSDGSILTIDPDDGTSSERFIPALNQWIDDAVVPLLLYERSEIGPALLLPDGRAFFMGASGHTAVYTPSGSTNSGSWTAGPDLPNNFVAADNPCAMMKNGKILCALASRGSSETAFFEYDPDANSFSPVNGPSGDPFFPQIVYALRMLDLPDGTVLLSTSDTQLYVYQPDGPPLAAGKPTISRIALQPDGSYLLAGTLLNGISTGAVYGDDAQMDSNYPLVRLTDGNGKVYYAPTFNWSSTGVMTGNAPASTQFRLPPSLPAGTYSLVVIVNGIASAPASFSVEGPLSIQRTVMTPGAFTLFWNAVPGQTYHVQYQNGFGQIDWLDLCGTITATNTIGTVTDTNISASRLKLYRVLLP